jgi:hypothetical protein
MRPEWLDKALAEHAPESERVKGRAERARLQAALRSDKKADRDAAKAEVAEKTKPAKKAPAKKR